MISPWNLRLSIAVEEINFLTPLEDITLNDLGLKATFECVISKEGLTAEWLKDGKPIKASDKVTIQSEGNTHRLIVEKSYAEDEGTYTVKFKGASTKAKLTIKGKSSKGPTKLIPRNASSDSQNQLGDNITIHKF